MSDNEKLDSSDIVSNKTNTIDVSHDSSELSSDEMSATTYENSNIGSSSISSNEISDLVKQNIQDLENTRKHSDWFYVYAVLFIVVHSLLLLFVVNYVLYNILFEDDPNCYLFLESKIFAILVVGLNISFITVLIVVAKLLGKNSISTDSFLVLEKITNLFR